MPMMRTLWPASTRTVVRTDGSVPSRGSVWAKASPTSAAVHAGSLNTPSMAIVSAPGATCSTGGAMSWAAAGAGSKRTRLRTAQIVREMESTEAGLLNSRLQVLFGPARNALDAVLVVLLADVLLQ